MFPCRFGASRASQKQSLVVAIPSRRRMPTRPATLRRLIRASRYDWRVRLCSSTRDPTREAAEDRSFTRLCMVWPVPSRNNGGDPWSHDLALEKSEGGTFTFKLRWWPSPARKAMRPDARLPSTSGCGRAAYSPRTYPRSTRGARTRHTAPWLLDARPMRS